MALQKQPLSLSFNQGVDTKTDKFQIPLGKFQALSNSVFTTSGRLTKRNGYARITDLPNSAETTLTTLNNNLIATGSNLYAFSQDNKQWLNRGIVQPVQLSTQPLIRASTSQSSPDTAFASNGMCLLTYTDNGAAYYQITDSNTNQQIVSRTLLPSSAKNPRAFVLGIYFVITFVANIAATPTLQYIAIPMANPASPKAAVNISASVSSVDAGYDAFIINDIMFIAWDTASVAVGIKSMSASLIQSTQANIAGAIGDLISVTGDVIGNMVWVSYYDSGSMNGFSTAYNYGLGVLVAPTAIITGIDILELTSIAINRVLTVFYEVINNYSYNDASATAMRTDYVSKVTVTPPVSGTGTGTVSAPVVVLRSVGLASKPFFGSYTYTLKTAPNITVTTVELPPVLDIDTFISSVVYLMVEYGDITQTNPLDNSNQPTYFLIDSSGNIYMRLAYSNAGGYATTQVLPSISLVNGEFNYPYLVADFLATVNKSTATGGPVLVTGTPTNAIYTQYGVNLATFGLNTSGQQSSEIAGALHLTGGQLWEYDGVRPVEHGFHVWPENVVATTNGAGGLITAGTYNYVFTYEWTDNQGNLHRSAPSIPFSIVTTGATSTNTINVPTLRLTYKISPNPVRIVGYRWSVAQQVYYQFTSLTSPTLNNPAVDQVTFTDTKADSAILGNTILYTTGGVIENIAAPASTDVALFDNRLFIIDAEDQNLLWYSKQVIENVPVEMSDLLTIYVAPTTGAQGSTGPMRALSAMDDKLIIFKKDAIYYINGNGPDNTGSNSTYSQPVFITSSVGSINPNSITLTPNGVMFQSDKGIYLLGRDLSTPYIGAPVESFNSNTVVSAETIPATTQVRFILDNNQTLMYDYYFDQWATHTNIEAISATLWQGMHTYLNSAGQIYQETLDTYVDGAEPVLMSLVTSWINIAGVQGFERFYFANLLGTYFSPFKLNVSFAYNYNPSNTESIIVTPVDNPAAVYGDEALWGSGPNWGGSNNSNIFLGRVFPSTQKCQSFQVTIQEVYDSSLGQAAGQGLNLSGLLLVVGMKKGYRTQSAARSFGG